jgi:hypothetical protein
MPDRDRVFVIEREMERYSTAPVSLPLSLAKWKIGNTCMSVSDGLAEILREPYENIRSVYYDGQRVVSPHASWIARMKYRLKPNSGDKVHAARHFQRISNIIRMKSYGYSCGFNDTVQWYIKSYKQLAEIVVGPSTAAAANRYREIVRGMFFPCEHTPARSTPAQAVSEHIKMVFGDIPRWNTMPVGGVVEDMCGGCLGRY